MECHAAAGSKDIAEVAGLKSQVVLLRAGLLFAMPFLIVIVIGQIYLLRQEQLTSAKLAAELINYQNMEKAFLLERENLRNANVSTSKLRAERDLARREAAAIFLKMEYSGRQLQKFLESGSE